MPTDSELVASIMLCDGIIEEKGTGKLTLIGTFTGLGSPNFPIAHPGITALISVTNFQTHKVSLDVTVRIQDKTGHVIVSSGNHVEAQFLPNMNPANCTLEVPVRFPPTFFPQAGTYSVVALVDSEEVAKKILIAFSPPLQSPTSPPA
jgi:hypothetical protein